VAIGAPIAATTGKITSGGFTILGTGTVSTQSNYKVAEYFPVRVIVAGRGYFLLVPSSMVTTSSQVAAPELTLSNPVIVKDPYDAECEGEGFLRASVDCSGAGYDSSVGWNEVSSYAYLTNGLKPNIAVFAHTYPVPKLLKHYGVQIIAPPQDVPLT